MKNSCIYGVGYKRDENGNRLVDENGLPIAGEAQVIGKVSPDFLMGFNTTLRLWKCTISAVLDWKQGGQMYSRTTGLADYYGVSKRTENREGTIIFDGYKTMELKMISPSRCKRTTGILQPSERY
ncbi:MAG: hypothetical protein ACLT63_17530 [Bacteroides xylanisolvens]